MENKEVRNQFALRQSLYASAAEVGILLVLYIMGANYFVGWVPRIILKVGWVIYYFVIAYRYRKLIGGFISFKGVFRVLLIISTITCCALMIFNFTLYNIIDQDMAEKDKQSQINQMYSILKNVGASEQTIDDSIKKLEEQDFNMTAQRVIWGIPGAILLDSIVILIVALIVKRKDPNVNAMNPDEIENTPNLS